MADEVSIRFGSAIKGFLLTFQCKRHDMRSWYCAQSDALISKADGINQNDWISDILGVSSFPLLDTREQAFPCFVQSREISTSRF
ncbi:hypothetical protein V6N13_048548 [Hibiscus sabdariffa]